MTTRSSKRLKKSNSPPKEDVTTRSTASIFRNVDPQTFKEIEKEEQKKSQHLSTSEQSSTINQQEDLSNIGFPLRYVYQFQDFLNDNLSVLKGAQILVFGLFIQLTYLRQDMIAHLKVTLPMIFFNLIGVVGCMVLSVVKSKEEFVKPPEFGYFYSVFIPTFLNILYYEPSWFLVNCALNYFICDKMNPIFNLISSIMFYEIYKDEAKATIPTAQFIQYALTMLFFSYALNILSKSNKEADGEKSAKEDQSGEEKENKLGNDELVLIVETEQLHSLRKSEVQLISILLINLLFNPALSENKLPLLIFQKLVISLTATSFLFYPVYAYLPELVAVVSFLGTFSFLTIYQLNPVLEENALVWLYEYTAVSPERLFLFKCWVSAAIVSVPIVFYIAGLFRLNFRRKIWHVLLIAALTFRRSILFDQIEFTLIALVGMIIIFLLVEGVRLTNDSSFLGKFLSKQLAQFQDAKDLGTLNLSYIYLITGATIPIAYDYLLHKDSVSIIRYLGLISIGVGDTFASVIGQKFGSFKWKGSNKSVQGTVAFIFSSLLAAAVVDHLNKGNAQYTSIGNWENFLVAIILGGVLEGVADLNDNYLIPTFIPLALELVNRFYND